MPKHQETVTIEAPVEAVFEAMTDLERWRAWWPRIDWVKLPSGWSVDGPLACRVMGMNLDGAVTAYELNRELGFTTSLPAGGRVTQRFTFDESEEPGTSEGRRTTVTVKLEASGLAGMMFTRKRLLRELDRFKVNVEEAAGK